MLVSYFFPQKLRLASFKGFQRTLPFPALSALMDDFRLLGVHVPIHVNGLQKFQVMCRFEGAFLHRIKLYTLHLDLQNRWKAGY